VDAARRRLRIVRTARGSGRAETGGPGSAVDVSRASWDPGLAGYTDSPDHCSPDDVYGQTRVEDGISVLGRSGDRSAGVSGRDEAALNQEPRAEAAMQELQSDCFLREHLADPSDLCTHSAELFFDALIATIDVIYAIDDRLTISDQCGDH
jgi:hypothetical protein